MRRKGVYPSSSCRYPCFNTTLYQFRREEGLPLLFASFFPFQRGEEDHKVHLHLDPRFGMSDPSAPSFALISTFWHVRPFLALIFPRFNTEGTPNPSLPSFALVSTPRACQTLPRPRLPSFRRQGHARPFLALICPSFDTDGMPDPSLPLFALVSMQRARQTCPHLCCLSPVSTETGCRDQK